MWNRVQGFSRLGRLRAGAPTRAPPEGSGQGWAALVVDSPPICGWIPPRTVILLTLPVIALTYQASIIS